MLLRFCSFGFCSLRIVASLLCCSACRLSLAWQRQLALLAHVSLSRAGLSSSTQTTVTAHTSSPVADKTPPPPRSQRLLRIRVCVVQRSSLHPAGHPGGATRRRTAVPRRPSQHRPVPVGVSCTAQLPPGPPLAAQQSRAEHITRARVGPIGFFWAGGGVGTQLHKCTNRSKVAGCRDGGWKLPSCPPPLGGSHVALRRGRKVKPSRRARAGNPEGRLVHV
jgi:hypothetical protein